MIVTHVENGWEIVFQPAHGLLAGALARNFAEDRRCRFWFETVAAIICHDDSKVAFDRGQTNYLTDVGAPKNFAQVEMTAKQRFIEVRDRLENAYRKHRWIGLLESQHADFLYRDSETSDLLLNLLQSERQRRADTLDELQHSEQDLHAAYDIMRWCDRCSLILCQNGLPEMGRRLEIITFEDGTRFDVFYDQDQDRVRVDPWPFESDELTLSVEVHHLKQLAFQDDADLEHCLKQGETTIREWAFGRSTS